MPFHAIKFQPRLLSGLIALVLFVTLLALGTWQVHRLHWKETLLADMAGKLAMKEVDMPTDIDPAAWQYRKVRLNGSFTNAPDVLLRPRVKDGVVGVHVLRAFKTSVDKIVFVNLGWSQDGTVKAPHEVTGIVMIPQKNYFTPDNNPSKNEWYWADIPAMARARGIQNAAPFLVAVEGALPEIPNNHFQYAVFWFFMAFVLALVYILSHTTFSKRNGR